VGLPVVATLAPTAPLPSPVALGAETDVRLDQPSRPVRVRVPYAGIDLPVVSSERNVRGNRQGYPLCDVAQYWTRYELPGAPGTTWIYAHAQEGMFLPLFTISEATDGRGLLGKVVTLQTRDKRLLRYRINEVKERARTVSIARRDDKQDQRLILQTSTGPPGTIPKLQVAAELIDAREATEPAPKAQPRACWQPRPKATPKRNGTASPTATPAPAEVVETEEPIGGVALVVGSGAILLGATFLAVYIVRRP
jgi:hypothetical protein